MNAKEAREKAMSVTHGTAQKEYADVKKQIAESVEAGNLSTTWNGYLSLPTRNKLNKEGFSIGRENSYRNENYIEISW